MNFTTKGLVTGGDVEKAKEIVRRVEPDVEVLEKDGHNHAHDTGRLIGKRFTP